MIDFDLISKLVLAHRAENPTADLESLRRTLCRWWAIKYNRPFKDELLSQYTLEELAYEYLFFYYLDNAPEEQKKKMEEEELEWARKEIERMNAQKAKEPPNIEPVAPKEPPKTDLPLPDLPEISTRFEG